MSSTERHLTAATLALAGALVLTGCGDSGEDTATATNGSSTRSESPSSTPADTTAMGNDADAAFLAGMKPHHEQAVEMSDMVLAADPPAPVAELARQVKATQAPEIEQMDQMMDDLDHVMDGHMGEDMAEHGGMMSDADMDQLMDATGTDAARMYLEGMIKHHQGAIAAAETQIEDGQYQPAVELAEKIAEDQAGEIAKMEDLLASL